MKAQRLIAILVAMIFSTAVIADDNDQDDSGIAPQALDTALEEFAERSGLQVIYLADVAKGKHSNGAEPDLSDQATLDQLLASTDLEYEFLNDNTVTLQTTDERGASDSKNSRPTPMLMAQNQTLQLETQTNSAEETTDEMGEPALEEIIVVGSQIRGVAPAGADVLVLGREYIEQSGFATTQEILRSIPQNAAFGETEQTMGANLNIGGNRGFSSSANLRGLGTQSTLSLVNGRRTAPGGSNGGFTDLNFVPASAIERIEVLADGASAIYGSDAIAGVVNITLRDDYDGAETRLRYGPGTSDIEEFQFSQIFGKSWNHGNLMLTYQYSNRSELESADRSYARDSDLTRLGGTDSSSPISNPGNIVQYTAADGSRINVQLAIPGSQDGTALAPLDLIPAETNLQNIREGSWLLPSQEQHSALLSVSQQLSSNMELFAELRYSKREFESRAALFEFGSITVPNSNPFFIDLDPLGGSTELRMTYSFGDDFGGGARAIGDVENSGAILGATFDLGDSWQLEIDGSYSTEDTTNRNDRFANTALLSLALADANPATAFNPFGDGSNSNPSTLSTIEGFSTTELESELTTLDVRADGDLFDLPGGSAKLSVGGQFVDQSLGSRQISFRNTLEPIVSTNANVDFGLSRDIAAAYMELYFPFLTEQNARPGIKKLSMSIAGRYENYSDFGDTFNPKIGLAWSPVDSLTVRATSGTSFRAPFLTQLDISQPQLFVFATPNPTSPTGRSIVIFRNGNSATLQPEEGSSWTAGFEVKPISLPGFRVSLTYFETDVDEKIGVPVDFFTPLTDPDRFAPIIESVPGDVSLAAVASLLGDPGCINCGAVTADQIEFVIDRRLRNINKSSVRGWDLNAAYAFETNIGSFSLSVYASDLIESTEETFDGDGPVDILDDLNGPVSLKLRALLSWHNNRGIHAALFANHITDYTLERRGSVCAAEPGGVCKVDSWTTWDLNVGYDFDAPESGFLTGTRVALNIRNVFDSNPPFADIAGLGLGFDPINADPWQRHLTVQLTKEW